MREGLISASRRRPTLLVAERELREATRQRSYRISLLLSIAALAVVIVIANLAGGGDDDPERVVVAGADGAQRVEPIEQLGTAIGIELEVTTAPDDAAAEAAVVDEHADVAVLADGSRLATPRGARGHVPTRHCCQCAASGPRAAERAARRRPRSTAGGRGPGHSAAAARRAAPGR